MCQVKPFAVWLRFILRMSAYNVIHIPQERVFQTLKVTAQVWCVSSQAKKDNLKENVSQVQMSQVRTYTLSYTKITPELYENSILSHITLAI